MKWSSEDQNDLFPEGKYEAIPLSAALGETQTGKEQVGIEFDIQDLGVTGTHYGFFTEDTARRTIETLRHCGWQGDDLDDLSSVGRDRALTVRVTIKHEFYDVKGVWNARIAWVNPLGGVAIAKPLEAGRKKDLANRLRGLVMDVTKSTSVASSRGNGAIPTPPGDGCPV